jgi:hypothetical protein
VASARQTCKALHGVLPAPERLTLLVSNWQAQLPASGQALRRVAGQLREAELLVKLQLRGAGPSYTADAFEQLFRWGGGG